MKRLRIGIIGIGGFGKEHLRLVEKAEDDGRAQLVAVAEKYPQANVSQVETLRSNGVQVYQDYICMLDCEKLDAVTIATPIPFHYEMAIAALERGIHVFLEKPPTVLIQELLALKKKAKETKRICAVGFQQIASTALRKLQEYLVSGELGQVKQVVGVGKWKRPDSYYERANWAGRLMINGTYVLDGPLSNPLSHVFNNCLFLASSKVGGFAAPKSVKAEFYRAHPIEGEDTNAVFARTGNDVEVYFYSTVCAPIDETPHIKIYCTEGTATFLRSYPPVVTIEKRNGKVEQWEYPPEDENYLIFTNFLDGIAFDVPIYCSIEDTEPFVRGLNGAYLSARRVVPLPSEYVIRAPEGNTVATTIADITQIMDQASEKRVLFSDFGVPWAVQTLLVEVEGLRDFALSFQ
ncbi:MAG: Gfo/Idh/MocA family oxidoreductase [Limnochordia bacterium]|nr:Gfo/Idh/MocA family oxidoreductase [Limnochordia bacterium]MDD4517364.1 Gfo/Idh/MocA family oxidoreductase [Limnochordia bacterium]